MVWGEVFEIEKEMAAEWKIGSLTLLSLTPQYMRKKTLLVHALMR